MIPQKWWLKNVLHFSFMTIFYFIIFKFKRGKTCFYFLKKYFDKELMKEYK